MNLFGKIIDEKDARSAIVGKCALTLLDLIE
jgi:hypothetical protein